MSFHYLSLLEGGVEFLFNIQTAYVYDNYPRVMLFRPLQKRRIWSELTHDESLSNEIKKEDDEHKSNWMLKVSGVRSPL